MQNKNKTQNPIEAFKELNTTVVIVNNLSRNLTKKHLSEIFGHYGPIKGVFQPKDEESKLYKTYAYLEFNKKEDAELACLYMDEAHIDGYKIKAEILNPPKENLKLNGIQDEKENNLNNKSHHIKRRKSRSRSRRRSQSNPNRNRNYTSRYKHSQNDRRRHKRESSSSFDKSSSRSSHASNKSSHSSH